MSLQPDTILHRPWSGDVRAVALLSIVLVAVSLHAGTLFSIDSARGHAGATIQVPVTLLGETNVVALQADILFDPANLLPAGGAAGSLAGNSVFASSAPAPGLWRLVVYSPTSVPMTNGVVATLKFAVQPSAAQNSFVLSLSNVLLVTASPVAVPSANRNGNIVMNPIFVTTNGGVGFILAAPGAGTNIIQASTDLLQWTDIGTVVPTSTSLEFMDTNAILFPRRFYRTLPLP